MELKAKVIQILPLESGVSARGDWSKQTIIIETPGEYPKQIAVSFFNPDNINIPEVGEVGTFHINLESREFNGKWYSDVKCWKVESF